MPTLPSLDALLGGSEGGARGLWDLLGGLSAAGGGLFPTAGASSRGLVTPGYVTVLSLGGDGPLGGVFGAVNALRALSELTSKAAHPRLLLVDLPTGVAVPGQLAAALGRFMRTARQNDVALGLSAESTEAVADVGGTGALLSTVFAFPTSSPAEARRLRTFSAPTRRSWCTRRGSCRGSRTRCGAPCAISPAGSARSNWTPADPCTVEDGTESALPRRPWCQVSHHTRRRHVPGRGPRSGRPGSSARAPSVRRRGRCRSPRGCRRAARSPRRRSARGAGRAP